MNRILLFSFFSFLLVSCSGVQPTTKQYTGSVIRGPEDVSIRYLTSDLDSIPEITRGKIPAHPDSLRRGKGWALLQFTINEKGRTEDIQTVEQEGDSVGGNAAYAIRFWHFKPAMKDGVAVPCKAEYRFSFRSLTYDGD